MLFGKTKEELEKSGGICTFTEINQQPATWRKTVDIIASCKDELQAFIKSVTDQDDYLIVFSGAGTSEYMGNAAYPCLAPKYNYHMRDIGTTDVVMNPWKFLSEEQPTLLVSFARSGNSKESMGTIRAAEKVCKNLYHLIITCNPEGQLAKAAPELENCFMIQLPPETNDKSLAMTSSFSNMYLAAILAFQLDEFDAVSADVLCVCDAVEKFLTENYTQVEKIINDFDFNRVVFLGAAEYKGIAREVSLKVLELNTGKVVPFFENPIAFRHGAKSIINDETLTVMFMSDDELSRKYENDMLEELCGQRRGNKIIVCENEPTELAEKNADVCINFNAGKKLGSAYLALGCLAVGQTIAVMKSQHYGIFSDNFIINQIINENAKKGVTIYPVE